MNEESLWQAGTASGGGTHAEFHGPGASFAIRQLVGGSTISGGLSGLHGRSVLICTKEQLPTAVALVELDGIVRRMVLCTPDLSHEQLAAVASLAEADAVITDRAHDPVLPVPHFQLSAQAAGPPPDRTAALRTEWVLLTSGTTGTPKLVAHSLCSLAGPPPARIPQRPLVWSTFYDIRRYGGLQIYLRALRDDVPLVLSCVAESLQTFLARAATAAVTHISGTPSHWRRTLMSGACALIDPQYVRLSGEIADQPLLDGLRAAYPKARIVHAFASTEAGLAFDVEDGRAGFPASYVGTDDAAQTDAGARPGAVEMRVTDGTLRIRSNRVGSRYLGANSATLVDAQGFIDTGDLVERVADRYQFRGRRGGVINVGGLKVYPEEVEAVLNSHARVRMSLVRARRNPITGAIVVADIVLVGDDVDTDLTGAARSGAEDELKQELLRACRRVLPAHKVPALLRIVPRLEMTAAGKLVRPNA